MFDGPARYRPVYGCKVRHLKCHTTALRASIIDNSKVAASVFVNRAYHARIDGHKKSEASVNEWRCLKLAKSCKLFHVNRETL